MHPFPSPDSPTEPILEGAAWNWLLDLRARLNVAVEVIDRRGVPLLPVTTGALAARLRALLPQLQRGPLEAATRRIGRDEPAEPIRAEGLVVVPFLLDAERDLRLLVAEATDPAEKSTEELAGVGEWLARSIASERASHAASAETGVSVDWHAHGVLHRLLNQAGVTGSSREVVRSFVEAMAIWADADIRAYVGDVTHRYTLDVALASADATLAPTELRIASADGSPLTRLTPSQAADLGFHSAEPVVIARVQSIRTPPWILAYLGPHDRRSESRFAAFVDLLGPRLDAAAEVEASRLLWALMQRLIVHDTSTPTAGIADALRELEAFVPCRAGVQILGAGGRVLLHEGDDSGFAADAPSSDDRLAVRLEAGASYSGVLTLSSLGSRTITAREHHLAAVAASVLRTWLDAVSSRGLLVADRRHDRGHAFEDLLARQLDAQRRADSPVSLLLLARSLKHVEAEARQATLVELRQHLRPFDAVGVLESGEVAIWLTGVGAAHAALVRERLRDTLETPGLMPSLGRSPIGLAADTIAAAHPQRLIEAARADARARTGSA